MVAEPRLELPMEDLSQFCRRWKVAELGVFGSVLRDDCRTDSDVDVLVTFEPAARHGLIALAAMERELGALLGRRADLHTRHGVERMENRRRRDAILSSVRRIYAA